MKYFVANADVSAVFIRQVEGVKNFGNVRSKPLIAGDQMFLLEIKYSSGAGAPAHKHDHETLVYVVAGKVEVTIEGQGQVLAAGDACIHPQGLLHGIVAIEDSTVLEIKSPTQPLEQFLTLEGA